MLVPDGQEDELHRLEISNFGALINIFPSGIDLTSCLSKDDKAFGLGGGTSMAAPHLAGVIVAAGQMDPSPCTTCQLRIASPDVTKGLDVDSTNLFL